MPLFDADFDPAAITPESLKAEAKAALAEKLAQDGPEIDTREGSYTDLLLSEGMYQIYKLYAYFPSLLAAAVPNEKSGEYLDSFAAAFGLTRTEGSYATAMLTFTGQDGAAVPAGTVAVSGTGLRFVTTQDLVLAEGTGSVAAVAEAQGDVYNLGPDTVTRMLVTLAGVESVTNAQAEGGSDTESDASLYERLQTLLSTPVASGNVNHYKQWARSVSGVGHVSVVPLWNGNGTVKVIIAGENNRPLDSQIVAAVAERIEEERPIGASVTVVSAQERSISVTAVCELEAGTDAETVAAGLEDELEALFKPMEMDGSATVRYNRVLAILLTRPGVVDYTSLLLNGATRDVSLETGEVPVLGEISVTGVA